MGSPNRMSAANASGCTMRWIDSVRLSRLGDQRQRLGPRQIDELAADPFRHPEADNRRHDSGGPDQQPVHAEIGEAEIARRIDGEEEFRHRRAGAHREAQPGNQPHSAERQGGRRSLAVQWRSYGRSFTRSGSAARLLAGQRHAPDHRHDEIEMAPMIGVDHHPLERHADKGRDQHRTDAIAAPVSNHLPQTKTRS